MSKRSSLLAAAVLFALVGFAQAGGLATIRVARLPETLSAGKPTWVSFTVHDVAGKPINNLKPVVIATRGDQRVSIRASRAKQEGGYQARLAFPTAGEWTLTVDSKYCNNTAVLHDIEVASR